MCGTARAKHIAAPIMVYNKLPKYSFPGRSPKSATATAPAGAARRYAQLEEGIPTVGFEGPSEAKTHVAHHRELRPV